MLRKFLTLCLASFALMAFAHKAQADSCMQFKPLGRACLPEQGRMLPSYDWNANKNVSPMPACHCPPKELCPKNAVEAENPPGMPIRIAMACCRMPGIADCDVMWSSVQGDGCGGNVHFSGLEAVNFCLAYKPGKGNGGGGCGGGGCPPTPPSPCGVPSGGGCPPTPPSPCGTPSGGGCPPSGGGIDATISALNSCLETCKPMYDDIIKVKAYVQSRPAVASLSRNTEKIKKFTQCEMTCRKQAVAAVNGTAPNQGVILSIADSSSNARMYDGVVLSGGAHTMEKVKASKRHAEYVSHIASGGTGKAFIKSTPQPAPAATDGLPPSFVCVDQRELGFCQLNFLNNQTCRTSGDCVAEGTPVLMADGTIKPIEKIVKGDRIRGQNGEQIVMDVVSGLKEKAVFHRINDTLLEVTPDHPLMTTNGWRALSFDKGNAEIYGLREVGTLRMGDRLITLKGEVEITSISEAQPKDNVKTYNLIVDGNGTFYANGVLVKGAVKPAGAAK